MPDTNNIPIVVIACKVFQHLLETHLPPESRVKSITFLDYGLHQVPRNLTTAVQELIDEVHEPSLVVLGYGLCGNGLHGIKSGKNTLLIPRTDDCIAILLGSYHDYQREFWGNPATYYLTKGWLESGSNPLEEHDEYEKRYGSETAAYLMDQQYQHYKRLALVAHNEDDMAAYRAKAEDIARYCERWGMRYEEILGSDTYVRQLIEVAFAIESAGDEFLVVPPGGELQQNQFLRR